jgi:hypothetical protein
MTVLDDIASMTAELAQEVELPVEPFGYGVDLSCTTDLTEDLAEVDPFSNEAIGEALLRRYTTERGTNPDDEDYGHDVRKYVNRGTTDAELRDLSGELRSEGLKDDRIDELDVTVTRVGYGIGSSLTVKVKVTPVTSSQSFTATLAVTSAEAILELD